MIARFSVLCPSLLRHVIFCFVFVPVFSYLSKNLPLIHTHRPLVILSSSVSKLQNTKHCVPDFLPLKRKAGLYFFIFFVFLKFVSGLSCSVYNFFPEHCGVCILIRVVPKHLQYLRLYFRLYFNITSMMVPGDPGRLGTAIYVFTVDNSWGQNTLHVCSYCGNPATPAGKKHPFT
jgi:hypothetical protein